MVMVLARIFSKLNMADLNFFLKRHTEPEIMVGTWFGECCRQVEAEEVSNSRNKIHQTTEFVQCLSD